MAFGGSAQSCKATQELKQTCLAAFSKLGDKATQEIGARTLSELVAILDNEAQVEVLLPLVYNTKEDQKPFARKVAVDLLGWLFHKSCPTWEVMTQQKHLNRAIAFIKARMMDGDHAAGDACVQTLSIMMESSLQPDLVPWTRETGNCILRFLVAMLSEHRGVQIIACKALKEIAEFLPYLPDASWHSLLDHLSNKAYPAQSSIAETIASCSSMMEVSGLIMMPEDSVLPHIPAILGADSSGLLGCLRSTDWQARRSAVCAIRAVLLVLGKALTEQQLHSAYRAVLAVKYDVAKNVRAAASECLPLFAELMDQDALLAAKQSTDQNPSRRTSSNGSQTKVGSTLRDLESSKKGSGLCSPKIAIDHRFRQSACENPVIFVKGPPARSQARVSDTIPAVRSRTDGPCLASPQPTGPDCNEEENAPPNFGPIEAKENKQSKLISRAMNQNKQGPRHAKSEFMSAQKATSRRSGCAFTVMWNGPGQADIPRSCEEGSSCGLREGSTDIQAHLEEPGGSCSTDEGGILANLESQLHLSTPEKALRPKMISDCRVSETSGARSQHSDLQFQLMELKQDQRERNHHLERVLEDLGNDFQSAVALLTARLARLERSSNLPNLKDSDIAGSPALEAGLPVRCGLLSTELGENLMARLDKNA